MDLIKLLRSQGFGSRNEVKYLIENEFVRINGELEKDWKKSFKNPFGIEISVDEEVFVTQEHLYIVMNKPADYETSHKPKHHLSVFELLPERFLRRNVQAVGRLDVDTTGLLLFSDDGQFIHQVSSGNKRCVKTYEVGAKHPTTSAFFEHLLNGVLLHDDNETVAALSCHSIDEFRFSMQIDSGKYHQVKRMVAAASNRVETLHRTAIGQFLLPVELEAGQWRYLNETEVQACLSKAESQTRTE